MNQNKYVFAQLVAFLDRNHFNYLARKYSGDRYVKHFTCWNQLLALMFGQLGNRESLRDLITVLEAHDSKCYHLGLGRKPVPKTTFATANQNRDYRIFEEFAFYMMDLARSKRATDIFKLKGKVFAFDSTTIPLCLSVFWWAKFRRHKGGVKSHVLFDTESQVPAYFHITTASVHDSQVMKEIPYESVSYYVFDRGYNAFKELYHIHQFGSFFVVRAKKNLQYKCTKWRRRMPQKVTTDAEIILTDYITSKKYKEKLRLVKIYDEEKEQELAFLTKAFCKAHPETPWLQIAKMRHNLAHGYYQVDADIVWSVIQHDLQPLREQVARYLDEVNWDEWEKNEVVIKETAVHKSLMQTASRMKSKGYDIREIMSITGLTAEEIEAL